MSETEYSRLAAQLTDISIELSAIREKLTSYNDFKDTVTRHELAIQRMDQRCAAVQDAKKLRTINWGAVWGSIIAAVLVAIIMSNTNIGG